MDHLILPRAKVSLSLSKCVCSQAHVKTNNPYIININHMLKSIAIYMHMLSNKKIRKKKRVTCMHSHLIILNFNWKYNFKIF